MFILIRKEGNHDVKGLTYSHVLGQNMILTAMAEVTERARERENEPAVQASLKFAMDKILLKLG
jgi:hypothetical protein